MMNLKKVIATLVAAMILTTGTVSVASAGGLFDFIKSVGNTAVSTIKTVGNAVYGAGKYVFTDADGEESFEDMKNSANEIGDGFKQMGESALKTCADVVNFKNGAIEMIGGAIATGGAAAIEGVSNLVTGNDDYSWTESASNVLKNGYDKCDEGFDTVADIATLAGGPVGALAANGLKVVKTAGEAAVGYKDRTWEDVGNVAGDAVLNSAITVATAGIGSLATEAVSATTGTVTSMATKATLKTVTDLADPNNDRGVVDTILQDVTNTALTNSVVGVLK